MASPRAFSGLFKRSTEPFDWALFLRKFPYQPVPVWLFLSAVAGPFAQAFPAISHAACQGRLRGTLSASAMVVYTIVVPFALTTVYYLAFGRRRLEKREHRLIADSTYGLMLALTAMDAWIMIGRIHEQWPVLKPGLAAIRAACWP